MSEHNEVLESRLSNSLHASRTSLNEDNADTVEDTPWEAVEDEPLKTKYDQLIQGTPIHKGFIPPPPKDDFNAPKEEANTSLEEANATQEEVNISREEANVSVEEPAEISRVTFQEDLIQEEALSYKEEIPEFPRDLVAAEFLAENVEQIIPNVDVQLDMPEELIQEQERFN